MTLENLYLREQEVLTKRRWGEKILGIASRAKDVLVSNCGGWFRPVQLEVVFAADSTSMNAFALIMLVSVELVDTFSSFVMCLFLFVVVAADLLLVEYQSQHPCHYQYYCYQHL